MRVTDVVVEVRDVNLARVGQIEPEYLDLRWTLRDQATAEGPGEWVLRLPAEHRLAPHLLTPGAGIIVTHVDPTVGVLLSGPGLPTDDAGVEDPRGTLTVNGVTDDVLLWNRLAYPTPTLGGATGQGAYHTVTGVPAETAMYTYVGANLVTAHPSRAVPGFTLPTVQLTRGLTVTRNARFDTLATLLQGIAVPSGLSFRVVQVGAGLQFQVTEPADRTGSVRLDVQAGSLTSHSATVKPPTLTNVIVMGQGDLADRTLVEVEAGDAGAPWGPWARAELALDQRQTDDPTELEQAGTKALLEAQGGAAVAAVPSDDLGMAWPTTWDVGDTLAVIVRGVEREARATAVTVILDSAGAKVGVNIGAMRGPEPWADLRAQQRNLEDRLAALERLTAAARVAPTA